MPKNANGVYMGSTQVSPNITVGQIIAELAKAGANQISMDYTDGKVSGLKWTMRVNGHNALFDMPVRVDPIQKKIPNRMQAERVAWRQILRWVQAQNAMIECGMAQAAEVYFAYHVPTGQDKTLFEMALSNQFKALPAPKRQ